MRDRVPALLRAHPVRAYFVLTFAISWALWAPAVATRQGWWSLDVPDWWHYAGAAGPASAALVVASLTEGRRGVRTLIDQYHWRRLRVSWLAFAIGSLVVPLVAGLVAARIGEGVWPAYSDIAKTSNLPALGLPLTFLVHVLTFGIGEETGWRGFALPRLQEERTALRATGLLAVGWGLWHLPSFFENPSYSDMSVAILVGWAAGLALGAVFLQWLYNSSQGSLLTVVIWHGLYNTLAASEAGSDVLAPVITVGVMATAIFAVIRAGPEELRGTSRDSGPRMRWSTLSIRARRVPAH